MNEAMFKNKMDSCRVLLKTQIDSMTGILERRFVFNRLRGIIRANEKLKGDNIFWEYYFKNYIDAQIMETMRILDKDDSSKNFFRLLDSLISGFMIDDSFFVSIKNSIKVPEDSSLNKAINASIFVLDVEEVRRDKYRLSNESEVIKEYRDWKIAHSDVQKWRKLNLSESKINCCIDLLHERIRYYNLSINGTGCNDLMPTIQYDWEYIFNIPWIDKICLEEDSCDFI